MPLSNLAYANERREDRVEVHHRAMATAGGSTLSILVVNISPNGLMARCEHLQEAGTRFHVRLPNMSPMAATIRWALGGRIGCEFDEQIPPAAYFALLSALRR